MATVKLDCTICPKKPSFSDLSHLLTHLASKGHLSHYFKAQVKSQQDADVLAELQAFDKWYSDNEMGRLLHDRMSQKEKKRSITRSRQPVVKARQNTSVPLKLKSAARRVQANTELARDLIDPRLAGLGGAGGNDYLLDHNNHLQSDSLSQSLGSSQAGNLRSRGLAESTLSQAPLAYMHPNMLSGYSTFFGPIDYQNVTSGLHLPVPAGLLSPLPSRASLSRSGEDTRTGSHEIHTSIESDPDPVAEASEYATLKGIIWPGMDLFDSASPHAKRIRNQKKDSSCLEQMRSYAATIEPNEDIYYFPSWKLKQSREITGQVESSSPEGREPPPRVQKKRGRNKRSRSERVPLADLDGNLLLTRRPGPGQPKAADCLPKPGGISNLDLPMSMSMPMSSSDHARSLNSLSNHWTSFLDDELEWQMTYGTDRQIEDKSCVPIFRDSSNHDILRASACHQTLCNHRDEGDLMETPSHRPRPRPVRRLPPVSNIVNNRFNSDTSEPTEQPFHAAPLGMNRAQENQENRLPSLEPYVSDFDNKNVLLFPIIQPQKTFGIGDTMNATDGVRRKAPFADFMNEYQNFPMPVMTPGKGDRKMEENPLSVFPSGNSQRSPSKIDQSPASINPLLDFSGFLNPSKLHETDDETLDDGVGNVDD